MSIFKHFNGTKEEFEEFLRMVDSSKNETEDVDAESTEADSNPDCLQ